MAHSKHQLAELQLGPSPTRAKAPLPTVHVSRKGMRASQGQAAASTQGHSSSTSGANRVGGGGAGAGGDASSDGGEMADVLNDPQQLATFADYVRRLRDRRAELEKLVATAQDLGPQDLHALVELQFESFKEALEKHKASSLPFSPFHFFSFAPFPISHPVSSLQITVWSFSARLFIARQETEGVFFQLVKKLMASFFSAVKINGVFFQCVQNISTDKIMLLNACGDSALKYVL